MTLDWLLITALATFRLSSLLVQEDGPFGVFTRLRTAVMGSDLLTGIFACIWCMSMYVGALCALVGLSRFRVVLVPFAASAGAIMVNSYVTHQD